MSETTIPKPGSKLSLKNLVDPNVVLHPTISKWRDSYTFDPLLYNSLEDGQIGATVFRQLGEKYELLAGCRRYLHQKVRGVSWDDLNKDIRENVSDREALIIAASENIFRKDFNPWEEARVINDLLMIGKMKVKEVAKMLGKSEAFVTNRRTLLSLSMKIQKRFEKSNIPIGYAVSVKKLNKFPEQQSDLLSKIVEGKRSSYNGIHKIEEAENFVTTLLDAVKEHEALLKAYGACPACGSKDISKSRYGDGNRLACGKCDHSWHKGTKEPWKLYELKQTAKEMGFEVDIDEKLTLTPQDIARVQRKQNEEREAIEKKAAEFPEKFRSPVLIEELIIPLIPGNVQTISVRGNNIEIELIEDTEMHFKASKKDYKTGEKGRIEVGYGLGSISSQEMSKKIHGILAEIQKATSS